MDRENLAIILPVLGKFLYTYPDTGFLDRIRDAKLFDDIPYESDDTVFANGRELLVKWQNGANSNDETISDYQDLFVGVRDRVKTPAWQSVYTSPEPVMFGDCTLRARRWYDKYGTEIKNIRHEPDDHMGIELMFYAHLLKIDGDEAQRFFSEHIAPWYARFFTDVAAYAVTDLYKGLALVLKSICSEIERG